ncbi:MAG TPA: hypothetical protein P5104_05315 [Bacteroidales bacterium]|nr:hypothetical protein [Bacteroidales bacterium]
MDKKKLGENLNKTFKNITQYLDLKTELYSLMLLDRSAKFIAKVAVIIIVVLLMFAFLLFLSFAFVELWRTQTGSTLTGYLIVAAFYLVISILIIIFKKQLFLNTFIKGIYSIFSEEEELMDNHTKPSNDEEDKD